MLTLPNIQQKEEITEEKGCEALTAVVDAQILLYEIDTLRTPISIEQLIARRISERITETMSGRLLHRDR
ncbi:MAG: hypothetical protein ACLVJ6_09410 [Merdibacter sp.]